MFVLVKNSAKGVVFILIKPSKNRQNKSFLSQLKEKKTLILYHLAYTFVFLIKYFKPVHIKLKI